VENFADLTEHFGAEDALARGAERFRDLVENTSDWIWEVDAEMRYVYASPKVLELLGYGPMEVLGKTPFDFMPSEEVARLLTMVQELQREPRPFRILENTNLHKNGSLRVLETSGVPVYDRAGRWIGFRGIDRDVTARKQAERERENLIAELREALAHIKTLRGLLPICASCKNIRDDRGYWRQVEEYIRERVDVQFSHGICPACMKTLYPEL
jgi:PAS domain S-box-containing protein